MYLKSADEAGSKLEGLPRGVIAVAPTEKTFYVTAKNSRKYSVKRKQLPLTPGCLSSVYRSQGLTLK